MMKYNLHLSHKVQCAMAACLMALPALAQTELPEKALPMIVAPHNQTIGSGQRTLLYRIQANVPFETSEEADWIHLIKGKDNCLYVQVDQNYFPESRTAKILISNAEKNLSREFFLTQGPDNTAEDIPSDKQLTPSRASSNSEAPGHGIALSFDNRVGTVYQSHPDKVVSAEDPAILTYEFDNTDRIDYFTYVPALEEETGRIGEVEIYTRSAGESDFKRYAEQNWEMTTDNRTVIFENGLTKPEAIQLRVKSGAAKDGKAAASCAEIRFFAKTEASSELDIFADKLYSQLRPGVTEKDLERLDNPFVKSMAYKLLHGKYDTQYRVADYDCYLHYKTLAALWNAPGKHYDQLAGVTGISVPAKNKIAVIVDGIAENLQAELKIVAWYVGKIGSNFDGGNPAIHTYAIHNGVNVIDYDDAYDGLAYICYYAPENPEKYAPIKVHFVNGVVNGYLSEDKTNAEMHALTEKAPNICMDVVSKKVHAVWTSKGLHNYCRAQDGSIGYKQYMNVLDSLITWEHRSLGFEKYDRIPKNRTMAYVNYTYYMFQGALGVSFHVGQEKRVLDCKKLIEKDDDAIWGLSHEWGHQHQMHPYFCWGGMGEVSNNVQSYYNIMMMGYHNSRKTLEWNVARNTFLHDLDNAEGNVISKPRTIAYQDREKFRFSEQMFKACEEMENDVIPNAADVRHAVAYCEGKPLCPLVMLHCYFSTHGFPDFLPDMYESLRQNDDPNGSQVEKQGAVDKYELIASCQNNNKYNKLAVLREKFPNSCWVKDNCIDEEHCESSDNAAPFILNLCRKTSRITGYNLTPYFIQWGFIRQLALQPGDYGTKYYIVTKNMYDEFIADMDELVEKGELKAMPEGMVEEISNCKDWYQPRPNIPN